jgi:hypothetical protein
MSFVATPVQPLCGLGPTPVDQARLNDYGDLRDDIPDLMESLTPAAHHPPNTKVTNHFWFVTFAQRFKRTAHCGRRGT